MRIGVLGATGMLGSQVLAALAGAGGHEIAATVRSPLPLRHARLESLRSRLLRAAP